MIMSARLNWEVFFKMLEEHKKMNISPRILEKKHGVYNGFFTYYKKRAEAGMGPRNDINLISPPKAKEVTNKPMFTAPFRTSDLMETDLGAIAEILSSNLSISTQKTLVKQIATRL